MTGMFILKQQVIFMYLINLCLCHFKSISEFGFNQVSISLLHLNLCLLQLIKIDECDIVILKDH